MLDSVPTGVAGSIHLTFDSGRARMFSASDFIILLTLVCAVSVLVANRQRLWRTRGGFLLVLSVVMIFLTWFATTAETWFLPLVLDVVEHVAVLGFTVSVVAWCWIALSPREGRRK